MEEETYISETIHVVKSTKYKKNCVSWDMFTDYLGFMGNYTQISDTTICAC